MDHRSIEKTGQQISTLSYGCMRFADAESAAQAVKKAVDLGVNYFDVAPGYGRCTAESHLAGGLKLIDRSKVIVTAKSSPGNGGDGVGMEYLPQTGFGIRTADEARREVERSMELLGVDHLDAYHLWAVHGPAVFEEAMKPGGWMEGVVKAHDEGLFDHIGITGHFTSEDLIAYLQRFPFTIVTLPFHVLDTSRTKGVEYCSERGIGVIAMNPLAGGALSRNSPVLQRIAKDLGFDSLVEPAFRFLMAYPGVTSALAGITYADQAVEDAAAVERGPLDAKAADMFEARMKELYANVKHFCTGCGYCGECPQGIFIPQVLELYTNSLIPSAADAALQELAEKLAENPTGYDPSLCTACKACEEKCPNKLPVSELMADARNRG